MTHELQHNSEREQATELIEKVGSAFHEQWREEWHASDAKKEVPELTREKATSDQAWIEAHGIDTVDIANTNYEDLPEDWKGENKAAAEFVVGLRQELDEAGVNGSLDDPAVREYVGDEIHKAWLSRNEWAKDGDLGVAFSELPLDEQEKDLDQYRTLQAVLKRDEILSRPSPSFGSSLQKEEYLDTFKLR